jgi:DNA-binding transcriptional ArsR family regulator
MKERVLLMAGKPLQQTIHNRPPKPPIASRSLIEPQQAQHLEALFKILANTTRLRLLHALILTPDLCVTEIAESIGLKITAVSNQLQKLVDRGILASQRNGNTVHYRVVDPCVIRLLDNGWCLAEDAEKRKAKSRNAA